MNSDSINNTNQAQLRRQLPPRDSLGYLLRDQTKTYIASLDPDNLPSPEEFECRLLESVLAAVLARNAANAKEDQWRVPSGMTPDMVAMALMAYHVFIRIDFSDGEEQDVESFPLYVYDEEKGIYVEVNTPMLDVMVREFAFGVMPSFTSAVYAVLSGLTPVKTRTRDANLDVVNNGIRHRDTGYLEPFSPDYVFTCKTAVDWNENAINVTIVADDGFEWNIEDAIDEIAGYDPEVREFLWRVIAASLRPNVRWDKSVWFYAKTGNNGKGTLCQLIRNLVGPGNHTSIPFADFNNSHFMLGALPRVQAVIVDENQVGKYVDDNAEFKSAVTNDVFRIDRKHKPAITARFYGLIIQCVNEIPRIRDRSDSFWRRVAVVHFQKCFTGVGRSEIKHDYIARKEVLEYVQMRALSMDVDKLEPPAACGYMLDQVIYDNNPIQQFAADILPRARWNLLPWPFLWDVYRAWYQEAFVRPSGLGRNKFLGELRDVVDSHPELGYARDARSASGRPWKSATFMVGAEPLIAEYALDHRGSKWRNEHYCGIDSEVRSTPSSLSATYRGLIRASVYEDICANGGLDDNE